MMNRPKFLLKPLPNQPPRLSSKLKRKFPPSRRLKAKINRLPPTELGEFDFLKDSACGGLTLFLVYGSNLPTRIIGTVAEWSKALPC